MCGIAGVLSVGGSDPGSLDAVRAMTDALRHRGPDDHDCWIDRPAGVALGHRRLSIIDLSPLGRQPMVSESGRYRIVFNGEVYNFRELRARLEGAGHRFNGGSDTEVMLAAVEEWGLVPAVQQFVGMFAFALWDAAERQLHLVRDRLGIKPLYYSLGGGRLIFGSELKSLHAASAFDDTIDRTSLAMLLRHGYIPGARSIYRNVRKLEPGTILTIAATSPAPQPKIARYWSVPTSRTTERAPADPAEAVARLDELIREAVRARLVADVPLGAFLSGGIDSSVVVGAMRDVSPGTVKTFSIGFTEEAYNEATHARRVAERLGTEHTELYLTPKEAQDVIPMLPTIFDEPFADPSQIPTYLVCRLARQSVTVALSGDGGDELFFGYAKYLGSSRWHARLRRAPASLRALVGKPLRAAALANGSSVGLVRGKIGILSELLARSDDLDLFEYFATHWKHPDRVVLGLAEPLPRLLDEDLAALGFEELMSYTDLRSYLPDDILTKVDRASMAVALEARVPLLDHRVVEYAAGLPFELKYREGQTKWALRQVLYKYVPRDLVDRPKMGFGVPIGEWLRGPLRDWTESLLDERGLRAEGFLDAKAIRAVWREHLEGRFNWEFPLWHVLMFQAWLRRTAA